MGGNTHAENDTAFGYLVPALTAATAAVYRELHTSHAIVVFQLRAYLRRDCICPWRRWQIEVSTKRACELFGRHERLV